MECPAAPAKEGTNGSRTRDPVIATGVPGPAHLMLAEPLAERVDDPAAFSPLIRKIQVVLGGASPAAAKTWLASAA